MNCPKCGAEVATDCSGIVIFECGTELDKDTEAIYELDEARFEIAKLKAELELIDQEHKSELATLRAELKRREVEWDVLWSKVHTHFDPKGVTVVFQLVIDWMREIRTQSTLRLDKQ